MAGQSTISCKQCGEYLHLEHKDAVDDADGKFTSADRIRGSIEEALTHSERYWWAPEGVVSTKETEILDNFRILIFREVRHKGHHGIHLIPRLTPIPANYKPGLPVTRRDIYNFVVSEGLDVHRQYPGLSKVLTWLLSTPEKAKKLDPQQNLKEFKAEIQRINRLYGLSIFTNGVWSVVPFNEIDMVKFNAASYQDTRVD